MHRVKGGLKMRFAVMVLVMGLSRFASAQDGGGHELYGDTLGGGSDLVCRYDEARSVCENGPCGRLTEECIQIFSVTFRDRQNSSRNSAVDSRNETYYPVMIVGNSRASTPAGTIYIPSMSSARNYLVRRNGSYFNRIVRDDEGRSYFEYAGVSSQDHETEFDMTGSYTWTTADQVEHRNTFAWKCRSRGRTQDQNRAYFDMVRSCNTI